MRMVTRMPKAFTEWKVLPHGPITKLAANLWWLQGSLPNMSLKRVMTIVRRASGGLVIHNPIALEESAMREIEDLGAPEILIVPSAIHRLDAPIFKRRYPSARVLTPKGARAKVEEVVAVDGDYSDFPADDSVRLEMLAGMRDAEGAMLVTSPDGVSVIVNDAVFNMDRKRDPLGFLFTTLLGSAPGPRVSRLAKLMLIENKPALRADLERYAALPGLTRFIVSHEKVAFGSDAGTALRRAASYL